MCTCAVHAFSCAHMWLLDIYLQERIHVHTPGHEYWQEVHVYHVGVHVCMHCVCVHAHSIISSTVQIGASPLYTASQEGYTDIVDTLLRHGADPNLACTVWGLVCSFHLLHVCCVLVHCPTSDTAAYSA